MAATLETPQQRSIARRRYTEEEIERGLLVLALNAGRPRKAADQLAAQFDMPIDEATLRYWRDKTHTERYAALASEAQAKVRERAAAQFERVVFAATDTELDILDQFNAALQAGEIPAKELPGAARNIATVKGINADKAALARNQPTQVVEIRGAEELYAAMRGLGVDVIDSTTEDIEDAEVVDDVPAISRETSQQRA